MPIRRTAVLALLAGPTALAFNAGGYFDTPRAWAGLVAFAVLIAAAWIGHWPRTRSARIALASLAALAAWTLASTTWAPIAGDAYHAGQLAVLYAATLCATALLLNYATKAAPGHPTRIVEPGLAAGALIVIGYGMSERFLPGVLHFSHSASAQGRLEQPLTYWNAMGELAALGLVLCARIAGDSERHHILRTLGVAASALLGMGLYLSFSRGALFACAAGLLALLVAAPTRSQLRALVMTVAAAVAAAAAAAPLRGVAHLTGSLHNREREGAIALLAVAAIALFAAAADRLAADPGRAWRLPRRAPLIAAAAITAGLALAIAAGSSESASAPLTAGASRLITFQSNRYDYWRVALDAFDSQPLHGVGAGGWAVAWLAHRPFAEFAQDAHSLELQTLAELGIVGALVLAAFLGGVAFAARAAHRTAPARAAGPIAALVTYVAHSPLDWDWQMPAVTLVALVLAGTLLALSGEPE